MAEASNMNIDYKNLTKKQKDFVVDSYFGVGDEDIIKKAKKNIINNIITNDPIISSIMNLIINRVIFVNKHNIKQQIKKVHKNYSRLAVIGYNNTILSGDMLDHMIICETLGGDYVIIVSPYYPNFSDENYNKLGYVKYEHELHSGATSYLKFVNRNILRQMHNITSHKKVNFIDLLSDNDKTKLFNKDPFNEFLHECDFSSKILFNNHEPYIFNFNDSEAQKLEQLVDNRTQMLNEFNIRLVPKSYGYKYSVFTLDRYLYSEFYRNNKFEFYETYDQNNIVFIMSKTELSDFIINTNNLINYEPFLFYCFETNTEYNFTYYKIY